MSLGMSTEAEKRLHFKIIRFMTESAVKLRVKSVPLSTAAKIYHKFYSYNSTTAFDPYLVATTCLYLGGKVEEEHLKLRDVINVCYRCMYKEKPPLEIGSTYWALREAVSQCELLILRVLKFHVSFVHPHKYLLHYLKSLYDWLHPTIAERFPIARTAWAILRDSYHSNMCLMYDSEHIAVAVLYMTLQCYGIEVPTSNDAECMWWEALVEDLRIERIRRIVKEIMDVYALENQPVADMQAEIVSLRSVSKLDNEVPPSREAPSREPPEQEKRKLEPPSHIQMDDVDDIDVFLYSDSKSQPPVQEPAKKKPKSPSPPPNNDPYYYATYGGAGKSQQQQSLPGMGTSTSHIQQEPKKPIRIPIPDRQEQVMPTRTSNIDVLSMNCPRPVDSSYFSQPEPSRPGSSFDDYFMGPKSPKKIEEDEDFDLLLFSRSEKEPEKKEKKNLFPILRNM